MSWSCNNALYSDRIAGIDNLTGEFLNEDAPVLDSTVTDLVSIYYCLLFLAVQNSKIEATS